ncbi:MAG: M23 family metallopeptidase [Bacteroidia bacterium]|nr:M23 family metallopeptidase [Bacteroidia bacterium]
MARKTKYFFNPKSLEFERVRDNVKYIVWRFFGLTSLVIVLGLLMAFIFSRVFASPREKYLMNQNRDLRREIAAIDREVDEFEKQMTELKERDLKIYRAMYEADPPKPVDYRGADYAELLALPEGKLIQRIRLKVDRLAKDANAQTKSYTTLTKLIRTKEEVINSIPAIQPVANKELNRMASGYGYRLDPFYHTASFHAGMDFTCDIGTEVYATGDGVVMKSMNDGWGYGNHVIISHGFGYTTLYGHLSRIAVRPGTRVKRGQVIGYVGSTGRSTGPHLHYEVRKNDNPLNPAFFYHNDLTDEQYQRMLELSKRETKRFD